MVSVGAVCAERRRNRTRSRAPALALALAALATSLPPLSGASDAPALVAFSIDDGVERSDGWWLHATNETNLTFTLRNAGAPGHQGIRWIALRLQPPEGSINHQGAEPVRMLGGSSDAPGGPWSFEPENLDEPLEAGADNVTETLFIRAAGAGIAGGASATFRVHFEARAEGSWRWQLRAAPVEGGTEHEFHNTAVGVDPAPPELETPGFSLPLASRLAALWINGTVREALSDDPSGLETTELVLEGPTPHVQGLDLARDGSFHERVDLLALVQGNYTLRLVARDSAGNDGGVNGTLVVDRTAPASTWAIPAIASRRPVVLAWTVADNVGPVVGVDVVRFVNGAWIPVVEGTRDRTLAVTTLLHGDHARYRLVAHDLAGNDEDNPAGEDARDLALSVDLLAPEVLGVQLGPTAAGHRLLAQAQDLDSGLALGELGLLREGPSGPERVATFTAAPADGTYTFDVAHAGLAPGAYGLELVIRDAAGHEARPASALELFVGSELPVVASLPLPPPGQSAFRPGQDVALMLEVQAPGTFEVTADASSFGASDTVELRDDGVPPDVRAADRAYAGSVRILSGRGLVPLTLEARSANGALGRVTLLVPVDSDPPQAVILEPLGGHAAPMATLRVEVRDDRPGVALSEVRANGEPVEARVSPDPATGGLVLVVDAIGLPHGPATVEVEVRDRAGNLATASVDLSVDATPPVVAPRFDGPRAPRENWFAGPVNIGLAATDPETGIESSLVAFGDGLFGDPPMLLAASGPTEVRLTALNGVGLRTVTTIVVGIDAHPPVIDSVERTTRQGSPVLVVRAHDDVAIEGVTAELGGAVLSLTAVGEEFVLPLPADPPSTVLVRVVDPAGNEGTTSFKLDKSDVPAASWIAVVLTLGLLASARKGARRWQ